MDIELLKTDDPAAIIEWEKALYAAFSKVQGNSLIRSLWLWDDTNERLAMRIGYCDQRIYCKRLIEGVLTSGMAVNVGMKEFQANAFGFKTPEPEGETNVHCEVIAAINSVSTGLTGSFQFRRTMFTDLYKHGYRWAWATTSERNYNLYCRMGGEFVEEKWIGQERRILMRFSLHPYGKNDNRAGIVY